MLKFFSALYNITKLFVASTNWNGLYEMERRTKMGAIIKKYKKE
jgi:hypothetical protein